MGAWTCRKWGSYHTGILGKRAADRGSENKGPEAVVRQTVRTAGPPGAQVSAVQGQSYEGGSARDRAALLPPHTPAPGAACVP